MEYRNLPNSVDKVLGRLEDVRPSGDGWVARCPCPNHNPSSDHPGDQHPSLRITLSQEGRILLKCRVGCPTDAILKAVALQWDDLFLAPGEIAVDTAFVSHSPASPHGAPGLMHAAYRLLLDSLTLSDEDREQLRRRGLTQEFIERGQYRTLRNVNRGQAAKHVYDQLGPSVLTVPGFVEGEFGVTLAGSATGLLIPVRDLSGNVQAIKIRRSSEPKYMYLSEGADGMSSGSPVHVPLGIRTPTEVVRVTEGELKADVCWLLDGTPTLGIPGVTQWGRAFSVLRELGAKTVIVAFDAPDLYTKRGVFDQLGAFCRALYDEDYHVELEDWYDEA